MTYVYYPAGSCYQEKSEESSTSKPERLPYRSLQRPLLLVEGLPFEKDNPAGSTEEEFGGNSTLGELPCSGFAQGFLWYNIWIILFKAGFGGLMSTTSIGDPPSSSMSQASSRVRKSGTTLRKPGLREENMSHEILL